MNANTVMTDSYLCDAYKWLRDKFSGEDGNKWQQAFHFFLHLENFWGQGYVAPLSGTDINSGDVFCAYQGLRQRLTDEENGEVWRKAFELFKVGKDPWPEHLKILLSLNRYGTTIPFSNICESQHFSNYWSA